MTNFPRRFSQNHDVSAKVSQLLQTRTRLALEQFTERVRKAGAPKTIGSSANAALPLQIAASSAQYLVDFAQRSILLCGNDRVAGWTRMRRMFEDCGEPDRPGLLVDEAIADEDFATLHVAVVASQQRAGKPGWVGIDLSRVVVPEQAAALQAIADCENLALGVHQSFRLASGKALTPAQN